MPIRMNFDLERGASAPVIICDSCHERITDASQAIACWREVGPRELEAEVLFCHKRECDRQMWKRLGGQTPCQELSVFLVFLNRNVNFDYPAAAGGANLK